MARRYYAQEALLRPSLREEYKKLLEEPSARKQFLRNDAKNESQLAEVEEERDGVVWVRRFEGLRIVAAVPHEVNVRNGPGVLAEEHEKPPNGVAQPGLAAQRRLVRR
jgi:hypothetical protein